MTKSRKSFFLLTINFFPAHSNFSTSHAVSLHALARCAIFMKIFTTLPDRHLRGGLAANESRKIMKRKAIALFSGGLDSILAAKIMLNMNIAVEALNLSSPFTLINNDAPDAIKGAQLLDIPIKVIQKDLDFLEMLRNPIHGYGKAINPCVDCRIFLLKTAKQYMRECGADFIITGEVLGQRPMSQRQDTMRLVERESGLEGLLLRPLSAQHFAPTIPEKEGWVDRERLLAIKGRTRKAQFELAEQFGIKEYPTPAGGCLLTELSFAPKVRDILDHSDQLNIRDFQLLKNGRHFRISERTKLIIGRDENDNNQLESAVLPEETSLYWIDGNTPHAIITGVQSEAYLEQAAGILLRYTKAETGADCRIKVVQKGIQSIRMVKNSFTEEMVAKDRIEMKK